MASSKSSPSFSPSNSDFDSLNQWLRDQRIDEVECLVPDLTGLARGKILPTERFTEDRGMRLPEVAIAMSVTGEAPTIYAYCEKMNLNVDTLIHEVGAGQMEINFYHGDPLNLADEVFLFKRTVREAALRHDMHATFMAKPIAGEPGSAMHVHQSVVRVADGRSLFSREDGEASQEFLWYVGGHQRYLPAVMALLAPYANSYRRIAKFTAAPINTNWGTDNRTVGLRSPVSSPQARRIENRVIGADANPYIALAATLACGYLGIKNRVEPRPECTGDAYASEHDLPRSLGEALDLLREEKDIAAVLGEAFVHVYTEVKEIEHAEFMKVISPWEREHLLLHV